jgi:acylphosphatase
MLVYLKSDGNIHVHAPFEEKNLMKSFLKAIKVEWHKNLKKKK